MKSNINDGELPEGVHKVLLKLDQAKINYKLKEFAEPAHKASEAAELLGCPIGAVVKSLIFSSQKSKNVWLILVSGKNRVDLSLLERQLGERLVPASPDDVEVISGFEVGSVPPFCLESQIPVIMDVELMAYEEVWASGGSVHVLVGFQPKVLQKLNRGRVRMLKMNRRE